MRRRPPRSTLVPYTTLFRSDRHSIGTVLTQQRRDGRVHLEQAQLEVEVGRAAHHAHAERRGPGAGTALHHTPSAPGQDRKSTRLNSSHANTSYAVFCLQKTP